MRTAELVLVLAMTFIKQKTAEWVWAGGGQHRLFFTFKGVFESNFNYSLPMSMKQNPKY